MTSSSTSQTKENKQSLAVLEMDCNQARDFFMRSESYCNVDLPVYFRFDQMLSEIFTILQEKPLKSFSNSSRKYDDINYSLLSNKDGRYAWRPFQLIHPAIYVELVKYITDSTQWQFICDRFTEFQSLPHITCLSMPHQSLTREKDKAAQILHWWLNIEQRSIELAMEYDYIFCADISDCYGSIYTHSIPWALHGKDTAKDKQRCKKLVGNNIDNLIQDMCYGQTNGIPQGSTLMDFIAEIVLGYADLELNEKLGNANLSDYKILRYRDDYRIFVNNPSEGETILKALTEALIDLGLKLNSSKTTGAQDVISGSIKSDKLAWLCKVQEDQNLQKHLLIIRTHGVAYPNSGSIKRALSEYYYRLENSKPKYIHNHLTLISIAVDIAYISPNSFPECAAIISYLLCALEKDVRIKTLKKIYKKILKLPHTGIMEIWLQRIGHLHNFNQSYKEELCQLVLGEDQPLWNSNWIRSPKLKKTVDSKLIFDRQAFDNMRMIISYTEIALFASKDYPFDS